MIVTVLVDPAADVAEAVKSLLHYTGKKFGGESLVTTVVRDNEPSTMTVCSAVFPNKSVRVFRPDFDRFGRGAPAKFAEEIMRMSEYMVIVRAKGSEGGTNIVAALEVFRGSSVPYVVIDVTSKAPEVPAAPESPEANSDAA